MFKKPLITLGWILALALSAWFLVRNIPRYFATGGMSPEMIPFKTSFLIHFVFGSLMIGLGPLQFVRSLRTKFPQLHRAIGTTYVISVLVSGLFSLYIAIVKVVMTEQLVIFGTGLAGLALASLSTTLIAYQLARRKKFELHNEWMIRSYVVTLGFTFFRLGNDYLNPWLFHLDGLIAINVLGWACWIVPLLVTESVLRVTDGRRIVVAR